MSTRHRTLACYIALLAICVATLLPTLAHAWAASQGKTWVTLCTASGTRMLAVPSEQAPPAPLSLHLDHCPWCMVPTALDALPAMAVRVVLQLPAFASPSFAFPSALRPRLAWAAAQPRAPPRFS